MTRESSGGKSSLERSWTMAARGKPVDLRGPLLCILLWPLGVLYGIGLGVYFFTEKLGWRKRTRLPCRVVSVGNLDMGGTGKTSLVERLAKHLEGRKCAVLLRGYRGAASHGPVIVSDGSGPGQNWELGGDEASLLAGNLPGVAIVAGKDRRVTGRLAVEKFGAEVIILDDGLQYWQLHRDADIVLVDARTGFGNGRLMPAGILREPATGLRRAAAVVITHADEVSPQSLELLKKKVGGVTGSPIFTAEYSPWRIEMSDGTVLEMGSVSGCKVGALCGIGTPESFEATLNTAGADVVFRRFFPDHHPFTQSELDQASRECERAGAALLLTTQKDFVRTSNLNLPANLGVVRVRLEIPEFEALAHIALG